MSGKPCYNFEEFFYWARVLRAEGLEIVNPAQMDAERMFTGWKYSPDQYEAILAKDLKIIEKDADMIFMLNGWEDSTGANVEFNKAMELGIPVGYEEKWI
jgi:hypothetical protein